MFNHVGTQERPITFRSLVIGVVITLIAAAAWVLLSGVQPAGAQGGISISCDKSSIQIGSGVPGQATCNMSGFAPGELVVATSPDPRFHTYSFNGGSTVNATIASDCTDIPETFTVTWTGQTSGRSASWTFTNTLPKDPSCPPSGDAVFQGSAGGQPLNQPIQGMAVDPVTTGYWLVAADGGIFSFGAPFYGSTGAMHLNQSIVGMASTPSGHGYWLVASDGGIFSYGDAVFYGSTGGTHLNQPIVAMASTPSGHGYWLVASDGGIFSYGDAVFYGSTGGTHLNQSIVAMASTPSGHGYWLVASDGGIFNYGDAVFFGSTGSIPLSQPIVGMAATKDGGGYFLVARDGGIFAF